MKAITPDCGRASRSQFFGIDVASGIRIPLFQVHNRQSFLWKSFEKTAADLEKLGDKLSGRL
jgi:hypothetical protein